MSDLFGKTFSAGHSIKALLFIIFMRQCSGVIVFTCMSDTLVTLRRENNAPSKRSKNKLLRSRTVCDTNPFSLLDLPCAGACPCPHDRASTGREVFLTAAWGLRARRLSRGRFAARSVESCQQTPKKNKKQTYSFTWTKVKTERTEVFTEHTCLSWEQRSDVLPLHDEHIDEVDEDAGSLTGVPRSEC